MQEKIAIRKKALENRKRKYFDINPDFFYPLLNFLKKNKYNRRYIISLYYPSNYEVNILNFFRLIKKTNIKTVLPVTKLNNQMNFIEWKYLDPLKVNDFGMLEPILQRKITIPKVFDNDNNRLGYGKCFYYRFLNKFLKIKKNIITIGVAFSFQKYKKIPVTNLDI